MATPSPRASDDPSWGRSLALLTLAGLAVRIGFLLLEPKAELMGDEPSWVALAERLARGHRRFSPLNRALIFYPPVYPYFLAVGKAVFGTLEAVKWLQAIVSCLLVVAVGRLGRLMLSGRAALLAAALTAFFPELIWYSVHFWSETLFLVLLFWSLERLLAAESSGRRSALAVAGLLWGAATLTRETLLYFLPFVAAWLFWSGDEASNESSTRGARLVRPAIFTLAALLTVAPWTCRNWALFHAFVPVSTFGAHSLWQGNTSLPREEMYRLSDSAEGPLPQYRLAWEMGWRAVRERQPTWIFEKLRSELPAFWGLESQALVHLDQGAYGPVSPWLVATARCALLLPYVAVLALSVFGLAGTRLDRAQVLLLLFLVHYNALHVVTFGTDRFRLPLMPVLFVFAAEGWVAWRQGTLRLMPGRRVLAFVLALALLLVLLPSLLPA